MRDALGAEGGRTVLKAEAMLEGVLVVEGLSRSLAFRRAASQRETSARRERVVLTLPVPTSTTETEPSLRHSPATCYRAP